MKSENSSRKTPMVVNRKGRLLKIRKLGCAVASLAGGSRDLRRLIPIKLQTRQMRAITRVAHP
jgi:hypothetical protein